MLLLRRFKSPLQPYYTIFLLRSPWRGVFIRPCTGLLRRFKSPLQPYYTIFLLRSPWRGVFIRPCTGLLRRFKSPLHTTMQFYYLNPLEGRIHSPMYRPAPAIQIAAPTLLTIYILDPLGGANSFALAQHCSGDSNRRSNPTMQFYYLIPLEGRIHSPMNSILRRFKSPLQPYYTIFLLRSPWRGEFIRPCTALLRRFKSPLQRHLQFTS